MNDCILREQGGTSDISRDLMRQNWKALFKFAAKNVKTGVLGVSSAHVEESKPQFQGVFFTPNMCANVAQELVHIGKIQNIPILNLYEIFQQKDAKNLMFDVVHPNASGHQVIADEVYIKLEELQWLN